MEDEMLLNFVTDGPTKVNVINGKIKGSWKKKRILKKIVKHNVLKKKDLPGNRALNPHVNRRDHSFSSEEKKEVQLVSSVKSVHSLKRNQEPNSNSKQVFSSLFSNNPKSQSSTVSKNNAFNFSADLNQGNEIFSASKKKLFSQLGLSDYLCQALASLEITSPTHIQSFAIPLLTGFLPPSNCPAIKVCNNLSKLGKGPNILQERVSDIIIQAQTGSGKTLTFVLPILQQLLQAAPPAWLMRSYKLKPSSSKSQRDSDAPDSPESPKEKNNNPFRSIGTLALILSPTRELARQTYETIEKVLKKIPTAAFPGRNRLVAGLISGGDKRKSEKSRLRKGIHILVATPGRLLDHLESTESMRTGLLKWLVLDEADRLMDLGFEEKIKQIVQLLHTRASSEKHSLHVKEKFQTFSSGQNLSVWQRSMWQTILCSATLKEGVDQLAGSELLNPTYVYGDEALKLDPTSKTNKSAVGDSSDQFHIPEQLKQTCVISPPKLRLIGLVSYLKGVERECHISGRSFKTIVFFSSCDSVNFYHHLLSNAHLANERESNHSISEDGESEHQETLKKNVPIFGDLKLMKLHGSLSQVDRVKTFREFSASTSSILFCTDVAARGLDLPDVTRIVQFDAPTSLKEYVHRVGRTARIGKEGEAILFLMSNELGYLDMLKKKALNMDQVPVESLLKSLIPKGRQHRRELYEMAATELQTLFERYVTSNPEVLTMSREAFVSSIRAYATHPAEEKMYFRIKEIHLGHLAKSFALREAPSAIGNSSKKRKSTDSKQVNGTSFPLKSEKNGEASLSLHQFAKKIKVNSEFSAF